MWSVYFYDSFWFGVHSFIAGLYKINRTLTYRVCSVQRSRVPTDIHLVLWPGLDSGIILSSECGSCALSLAGFLWSPCGPVGFTQVCNDHIGHITADLMGARKTPLFPDASDQTCMAEPLSSGITNRVSGKFCFLSPNSWRLSFKWY